MFNDQFNSLNWSDRVLFFQEKSSVNLQIIVCCESDGQERVVPAAFPSSRRFVFDGQELDPGQVAVRLVTNRRARRYIVRVVDDQTVRVTIPRGGSHREALAFFQRSLEWVGARLADRRKRRTQQECHWCVGGHVWYRGQLEPIEAQGEGEFQAIQVGRLRIVGKFTRETLRGAIEDAMREEAMVELPLRLREIGTGMGLGPKRITIRNQRTRWGSCSAKGTISLNWRLVQVPDLARDYVLLHELCHLRHLNHSPAFWAMVRHFCPQHRVHEAWLRQHAGIISEATQGR